MKKFASNVERDKAVMRILQNEGVRTVLIWECTVKKMMSDETVKEECLTKIHTFINDSDPQNIEI